jgi:hypothetical protein
MTPHLGHEEALTSTDDPHSGHWKYSALGLGSAGGGAGGLASPIGEGAGGFLGGSSAALGFVGAVGGGTGLAAGGRAASGGFGGGGGAALEKISSTLDSIVALTAGCGAGGDCFWGSISMSNIDKSVPQKLHFFEPGVSGESHIGHILSPLEIGNQCNPLIVVNSLYDMPG